VNYQFFLKYLEIVHYLINFAEELIWRKFGQSNMKEEKKQSIMNCTTFDELLDAEYGPMGNSERMKFEAEAEAFCVAETMK